MNTIRRFLRWLATPVRRVKAYRMTRKALALNAALDSIEFGAKSQIERSARMAQLALDYPPAAVAAIADVRGFGNLARIARRLGREGISV